MSLALLPAIGTLFLLLVFLVQPRYEGFDLVLLYLVSLFGRCLLEVCLFLKVNGGRVDLKERGAVGDLGEVEGGKTVVRIYYIKEESIFNK